MNSTREKLKQAGLALFLDRGYAGATIAAIESEAGLAPRAGGFYRHFESKKELALTLAREEIVEREDEFDFAELMPFENTRAELLFIARVYFKANLRQREHYALIQELRAIPEIREMEQTANEEMFNWQKKWAAGKTYAAQMADKELSFFTLTLFGGLLFCMTKKLQGITIPGLTEKQFIDSWATYWAEVLDSPR